MKKADLITGCIFGAVAAFLITSCRPNLSNPAPSGEFPPEIASIMINKCAISGCHNRASYGNADSLLTDTWDHLFDGSTSGAVVVPYSPDYSSLLYYCNTFPDLGVVAVPTMPISTTSNPIAPLTRTEYKTLYNWILNGAPDKNGNIPFASNPDTRQKFYITNQGCDLMAVIDAERKVIMRYIQIGSSGPFSYVGAQYPHTVKFSNDGRQAYVCFYDGGWLQKIDAASDRVIGGLDISGPSFVGSGQGLWSSLLVSPKGDQVVTADCENNGAFSFLDAGTLQFNKFYSGFSYPHGIASNATFDTFYLACQYGNFVNKVIPYLYDTLGLNPVFQYSLDGNKPRTSSITTATVNGNSPDPHDILMTPDYAHYFITCQGTNKVVIMDPNNPAYYTISNHGKDTDIYYPPSRTINVGTFPQELAVSAKYPYMFVSCQLDNSKRTDAQGSVYVINYKTWEVIKIDSGDFYQPHGIAVDDKDDLLIVVSINGPGGKPAHHASFCAGQDGWYTFYDLKTLKPVSSRRYELSVFPYSAATRFK